LFSEGTPVLGMINEFFVNTTPQHFKMTVIDLYTIANSLISSQDC